MQNTLIPIDWLHWSLAALPIIVLAFLLVKLRWTAQQAGTTGMFVALRASRWCCCLGVAVSVNAGAAGVQLLPAARRFLDGD